ncbi:MAG: response regulator [Methanospirillum sp.]|uniref:ATP-binding response regulator n=1 Tax=Methanospirillum sp. TaxID=45200 RepID=UPI00236D96D3|nr:response regulator [Methanospirillum sp.]MDD1729557.1 response regulator [Methanospirillum sp.]
MISTLYVDDDPHLLELGKIFLERSGYLSVDIVSSGQEAVQILNKRSYEAIISDYEMPHMDGIELLQIIRTCLPDIPFIIFTGRGREEIVIKALNYGADSYIQKGGNVTAQFAELENCVKKLVERRKNADRYQELVNSLPKTILEMDEQLHLTFINKAGIEKFGYTIEDISKPLSVLDLVTEPDQEKILKYQNAVSRGETLPPQEYAARDKQGFIFPIKTYLSPIFVNTEFAGFRAVCIDISEEKQAKKALSQANKRLNLMARITRHDIRNKITALLAYQYLSTELTSDPVLLEYLNKQQQITKSIEDHIEFTRFYQDIGAMNPIWQDVRGVILSAISENDMRSLSYDIRITNCWVNADQLLQKVFYNLIENSIRHGGTVTKICFDMELPCDDTVTLIYTDNGRGISPDIKTKIFDEGFGNHTGFGLFLIREILSITEIAIVENGISGEGARFEMAIPRTRYRYSKPG